MPENAPGQRKSSFSKYCGRKQMQRDEYRPPRRSVPEDEPAGCTNEYSDPSSSARGRSIIRGMVALESSDTMHTHAYALSGDSTSAISRSIYASWLNTMQKSPTGMPHADPRPHALRPVPDQPSPLRRMTIPNCSSCGS